MAELARKDIETEDRDGDFDGAPSEMDTERTSALDVSHDVSGLMLPELLRMAVERFGKSYTEVVMDLARLSIGPGRLSPEEFAKVMTHPVVGWEICKRLRTAESVLDCIRYHHERHDGSGYPDGLVGEEIPFQARLLAVADALDALTSERAYRRRPTIDEAVDLLAHETAAGKWDPEIFSALTSLAARGEADPRQAVAATG